MILANRHRIMLVDDEKSVLNALRRTLRNQRFDLEAFTDPAEALKRTRQRNLDVIVSRITGCRE